MSKLLICPHCNFNLDGGDVYEKLLEIYKDQEKALAGAAEFGWTPTSKHRFTKILSIYCREKDATIGWICPHCENALQIE